MSKKNSTKAPKATKSAKAAKPKAATTPEAAAAPATDTPKTKKQRAKKNDGKMSGLDAAHKVLVEAGTPMKTKDMVDTAAAKGYWTSGGKTPAATIYAAIIREIAKKGAEARFKKTDRGLFTIA
jgi:restriction system protein